MIINLKNTTHITQETNKYTIHFTESTVMNVFGVVSNKIVIERDKNNYDFEKLKKIFEECK